MNKFEGVLLVSDIDGTLIDGHNKMCIRDSTNIGAGRIVYQELTRITKSIADGDFFQNEELTGAMQSCIDNHTALHLMGLLSDGGVHSHNTHLYALVELAHRMGVKLSLIHI